MNTNNELGWKPDIPESYEDGEPAAYEAGFSDGYFYNKNHGIGGIVWYSIAEGHLPAIPDGQSYIDDLLLYHAELKTFTKGAYWFAETGFWRHNTGNWQPTHFAYINYPEPENSVKEQSS